MKDTIDNFNPFRGRKPENKVVQMVDASEAEIIICYWVEC